MNTSSPSFGLSQPVPLPQPTNTRVPEVFEAALRFQPLSAQETPAGRLTPLQAWMLENVDAWRVRTQMKSVTSEADQLVQVLVGEEGIGKSTQMTIIEDELKEVPQNLVIRLDLTVLSGRKFDIDARGLVIARVLKALQEQGLFGQYRANYIRGALDTDFWSFNQLKLERGASLTKMSSDALLSDSEIRVAMVHYDKEPATGARYERALQAATLLTTHRTILLVDNIDRIVGVRELCEFLGGSIRGSTILVTAVRPYNRYATEAFQEYREPEYVDFESQSQRVFRIANRRCYAAHKYLVEKYPQLSATSLEYRNKLLVGLNVLRNEPVTRRIVREWNNSNVRQMLKFVFRAGKEIQSPKTSPTRIQAITFKTLVANTLDTNLLSIFNPQQCGTIATRPFYFLRLRLLSYLNRRTRPTSLVTMTAEFQRRFGVNPLLLKDAVEDLVSESPRRGALVLKVGSSIRPSLSLLPAGRCFMRDIVTSPYFLSWAYDAQHGMAHTNRSGKSYQRMRLEKSVRFIRESMLEGFKLEHPYMVNPSEATAADSIRLQSYQIFGFGKGHWFLSEVVSKMVGYAKSVKVDLTELKDLSTQVKEYVLNLDNLLNAVSKG